MSDLSAFENAFDAALRGEAAALSAWTAGNPDGAPGLAVYRNTVRRGAVDALLAVFATVETMVGEAWLRAAAGVYAEERPPTAPCLLSYGDDFPEWLAAFPPARDTPYLASIAQLDRLWWDAYFAADAEALGAAALAAITAADLNAIRAVPHPSLRLAAFERNVASLWLAHQPPNDPPTAFQLENRPEQILIARSGLHVAAQLVDLATFRFLAACARGEALTDAADHALAEQPAASLAEIVSTCLAAGALTRLERADHGGQGP